MKVHAVSAISERDWVEVRVGLYVHWSMGTTLHTQGSALTNNLLAGYISGTTSTRSFVQIPGDTTKQLQVSKKLGRSLGMRPLFRGLLCPDLCFVQTYALSKLVGQVHLIKFSI